VESILEQINKTPGVLGSAILDHTGRCIVHALPAPYDGVLLAEVYRELRPVFEAYTVVEPNPGYVSFSATFDAGSLIVRNLGPLTVCVLAAADVNMSVFSVAFKVAALKLSKSPEAQSRGGVLVPASRSTPGDRSVSRSDRPEASVSKSSTSVSRSQSVSGFTSRDGLVWKTREEWQQARLRDPNAAGRKVMMHVLKSLARYVGSDAQRVLESEIERMGERVTTFPASRLGDLIDSASKNIASASQRRSFVNDALGD
jgi:hypothetical protein